MVKVKYDGVYLLLYKTNDDTHFKTYKNEKEMNQRILELNMVGIKEIVTVSKTGCWQVIEVKP